MTPRVRSAPSAPTSHASRSASEDEAHVREAFVESFRDAGRALTPDELRRLGETGEWPAWCDET